MFNLKQLLNKFSDQEILAQMAVLYPQPEQNLEGYKEVLLSLRNNRKRSSMKGEIIIEMRQDADDESPWPHVFGKTKDQEESVAICLCDWKDWLHLKINPQVLGFSELDALCHCLWEMTWYGFTEEEIKDLREDFVSVYNEIQEH